MRSPRRAAWSGMVRAAKRTRARSPMSDEAPRFELRRIDSDGGSSEPEIYSVFKVPLDTGMSRRGAFGFGAVLSAGAVAAGISPKAVYAQTTSPRLLAHRGAVVGLRLSRDGKYLLSAALDKTMKL